MNTEASTDDLFSFGTKNPDNGRTAVPTPEEEIKDFFFQHIPSLSGLPVLLCTVNGF